MSPTETDPPPPADRDGRRNYLAHIVDGGLYIEPATTGSRSETGKLSPSFPRGEDFLVWNRVNW